MRYTYTVYKDDGEQESPTRCDVTTRIEEIKPENVTWPFYVEVYDNMTKKVKYELRCTDDLEGLIVALERATAWIPKNDRVKWDPLNTEETDIQLKLPDANLKTAAAVGKPTMSAVPPVALLALGAAMQNGVDKYRKYNWREAGASSSVFYDAMMRHLIAWYSGEDTAADSKIHHLAHLMAGCAIILDAELHGKLNDDRNGSGFEDEHIKKIFASVKKG